MTNEKPEQNLPTVEYKMATPRVLIIGFGGVGVIASLNLECISKTAETVCVVRSGYEKAVGEGYKIESSNYGNFDNWRPKHIVKSVEEAMELGPFEYVFVSTKNVPDGPHPVLGIVEDAITPGFSTVILAQNGIDIELELYEKFPTNPILSGVTLIGSTNLDGYVRQSGFDNLSIGCFFTDKIDRSVHEAKAKKFVDMYSNEHNSISYDPDVRMTRWKKLVYNASVNPTTAIVGMDVDRATLAGCKESMMRPAAREIFKIAAAEGVIIPPSIEELMLNISDDLFYSPSMLIDVRKDQLMELETILGNPIRIAKKFNIEVPTLTMFYNILSAIQFRLKEANGLVTVDTSRAPRKKEEWVRWTDFLDGQSSQPLAHVDGGLQGLSADQTSDKTGSEGISSTVGVDNLGRLQCVDWEGLNASSGRDNDGWLQTVGEDDGSWGRTDLWQGHNVLGNGLQVSGVQVMRLGVGLSFGFVGNDVVGVWNGTVQWIFEEFSNEWGREVQDERFVVLCGVFTQQVDGLWRDGQMETTDVEELGVLYQGPVLWLFQMGWLEVVSSSQVGDQRSVLSGDQSSTFTGCNVVLDHVLGSQSNTGVGISQLVCVHVLTN